MKFSLKWLLIAVAFVAFGCVALYNANEVWALVALGFTTLVLLFSLVGAFHSRSFCIGMCVFGWGYLALLYVPPMKIGDRLVRSTGAMDEVFEFVHGRVLRDVPVSVSEIEQSKHRVTGLTQRIPVLGYFKTVGHCLFALVFAMIGGCVGQWFARTQERFSRQ